MHILISIFKFYHNGAVHQQGLEEIQSISDDPTLKFKLPSATRWLSKAQAIDAVRRSLSSLVSLDREACAQADVTALGLVTLCRTYTFVATVMFMSDVLSNVLASFHWFSRWQKLASPKSSLWLIHAEFENWGL